MGDSTHRPAARTDDLRARLQRYIEMLERPERAEFQKRDEVIAAMALRRGDHVADVGAGTGYFTFAIARAVGPSGDVWAVDIQPAMLDYIEDRQMAGGADNIRLHRAAPEDPRLPAATFDLILMVDVWHYLVARSSYARRLRASLKPRGRIVIIDYIPKPYEVRAWGPLPEQQLPRHVVDAEMSAAGLGVLAVHDFLSEQYIVEYAVQTGSSGAGVAVLDPT